MVIAGEPEKLEARLSASRFSADFSYFQIDRPLAKKLHKAYPERTTCGPQYFMMRVRTAMDLKPAASPIIAEDSDSTSGIGSSIAGSCDLRTVVNLVFLNHLPFIALF